MPTLANRSFAEITDRVYNYRGFVSRDSNHGSPLHSFMLTVEIKTIIYIQQTYNEVGLMFELKDWELFNILSSLCKLQS